MIQSDPHPKVRISVLSSISDPTSRRKKIASCAENKVSQSGGTLRIFNPPEKYLS